MKNCFVVKFAHIQIDNFLKENKHPQNFFRPWWARQEKNHRNVHNWRRFKNSETCSHENEFAISRLVFFFREIFSKMFLTPQCFGSPPPPRKKKPYGETHIFPLRILIAISFNSTQSINCQTFKLHNFQRLLAMNGNFGPK